MVYAIIELGGQQLWVESGKFYDVKKLDASPGQTVFLNKVLLLNKESISFIGDPCVQNYHVRAKVLKHLKSKKITVFKMKSKKNLRSKRGYRQDVTRLLIEKI